jgi:hypothetical protein
MRLPTIVVGDVQDRRPPPMQARIRDAFPEDPGGG